MSSSYNVFYYTVFTVNPEEPNFILRNFYNTAFKKFTDELNFQPSLFEETITSEEKKLFHLAIY